MVACDVASSPDGIQDFRSASATNRSVRRPSGRGPTAPPPSPPPPSQPRLRALSALSRFIPRCPPHQRQSSRLLLGVSAPACAIMAQDVQPSSENVDLFLGARPRRSSISSSVRGQSALKRRDSARSRAACRPSGTWRNSWSRCPRAGYAGRGRRSRGRLAVAAVDGHPRPEGRHALGELAARSLPQAHDPVVERGARRLVSRACSPSLTPASASRARAAREQDLVRVPRCRCPRGCAVGTRA